MSDAAKTSKPSSIFDVIEDDGDDYEGEDEELRERKRRRGTVMIVISFIAAITGLYFVPPFIDYGLKGPIACRPLGPWFTGGGFTTGFPSYAETRNGLWDALDAREDPATPESDLQARLGISEACEQARTNQQTALNIVLAGGVASLVGLGLHRQTRLLRRFEAEEESSLPNAGNPVSDESGHHDAAPDGTALRAAPNPATNPEENQ